MQMGIFVDPTPIRSRDLNDQEMAATGGGAVLPLFVAAVIRCSYYFGSTVYAVVDIAKPD
jgi:hypothetical protein